MRKLVVIFAAAAMLLGAVPAQAGAIIDEAVAGLRTNPVFVKNGDGTLNLSGSAVNDLRKQISGGTVRIYLAVLPSAAVDEVGGNADKVPPAIGSQLGEGVVGTVAGNKFRAGSAGVFTQTGMAAQLATEAFDAHRSEGLAAVLRDFVSRVQRAAAPAPTTNSNPQSEPVAAPAEDDGGVPVGLILLGIILLGTVVIGGYYVMTRRRAEAEPEPEYEPQTWTSSTRRRGDIDAGARDRVEVNVTGARYYGGGYYGGQYYGPGYYPGTFMDGLLWASILNNSRDDHHHHDDSSSRKQEPAPASVGASDYTADDYSASSDHGTSGGGGDFSSRDDVSSYTPSTPSYDPPSTSFDFGGSSGGSDWGGGSSDSGSSGGGGDF